MTTKWFKGEIVMGLDQYARSVTKDVNDTRIKELAYWRKHNRLQGWMEELWREKKEHQRFVEASKPIEDKFLDALDKVDDWDVECDFNCQEVELTTEDIDNLEDAVNNNQLPETSGLFYGSDSYESYERMNGYKKLDTLFIKKAREELKKGNRVIYSSWY